ncbi:FAR-17a/AIG1-like protein [Gigaspora rosea]|uniref:FAR-17a/AIG1-like protein n=1 Tax=Gigaspora rosea TaxID=44941 RepID=A0A397UTV5_9GLOM|nr:FAR-17a/AIG1-like protein [Gigaspora rosea]
MPHQKWQLLLHMIGTISFCYSFAILPSLGRNIDLLFEFTHLTIIGLLFSLVAFVFALIYDVFSKFGRLKTISFIKVISLIKDCFMIISVPLEGLISLMYWSIIIYDERLLLEPGKPRLPFLIDLGFHLFPALYLWIDFLFFTKEFRKSHSHVFYLLAFALSYAVWIQLCYFKYGAWPYPILGKLEDSHRIIFYFACFVLCTGIYHIGAFVHSIFNNPQITLTNSKKQKIL